MEIIAQLPYQKYVHSQDNETHVVVTLRAPALDWAEKRPNLAIIPAIDVSGSMRGPKLEYAKKSALKMVEHMKEGDVMGLVTFEGQVQVLVKPDRISPEHRDCLRAAINKLRPLGGTNFEGGMSTSLKLLNELDLPPSYLARVIIFTDGQPTSGIYDTDRIRQILKVNRDRVTVSAFGYGGGGSHHWSGCNQEFLTAFAEDGAGNYAFIENPDEALAAFGKELGGLVSTYATDLSISIEPIKGHRVVSVVSDVDVEERDVTGIVDIKVPDILSEEVRHLVLKVNLEQQDQAFPRQTAVFDIKARWTVITEEGKREDREGGARAMVQFVRKDVGDEDKDLRRIVNLAELARAQIEAEVKAQEGDYATAAAIFDNYVAVTRGVEGDDSIKTAVRNLQTSYASASSYTSSAGLRHGTRRGITRGMGVSSMDSEATLQVQSLRLVDGVNTAQAAFSASFSEEGTGAAPRVGSPVVDPFVGPPTATSLIIQGPLPTESSDSLQALANEWAGSSTDNVDPFVKPVKSSRRLRQKRSSRSW